MDDNSEFGGISGQVGMGMLLLAMGLGLGAGLYWSFAPSEVVRRQRLHAARRYLHATRATAEKMVDDAQSLLVRVRRGDPVRVPAAPPRCSAPVKQGARFSVDNDDDDGATGYDR